MSAASDLTRRTPHPQTVADAGAKKSLVRAFVAVPVPDPAAGELERFLGTLKPLARLRWVTRAQFHITLRFLGEQTRETIDRVKAALVPLHFEPFEIELSHAGAFPNKGCPRVLWLSGEQGRGELTALAEAVNGAIDAAGLQPDGQLTRPQRGRGVVPVGCVGARRNRLAEAPPEERAFKPHLTLARSDGTPLPPVLMKALEDAPTLAWRCEGFDLMRSRLTPQGAIYTKIPLS